MKTRVQLKKEKQRTEKRRFLGKLSNFESKEEKSLEEKHLKAYLKGNTHFIAKALMDVTNPLDPTGPKVKRWVKSILQVKQEYINI